MTPHIPEEFCTGLIDWSPFVITDNSMPPRDPDEDEEDEEKDTVPLLSSTRGCIRRTSGHGWRSVGRFQLFFLRYQCLSRMNAKSRSTHRHVLR
jgi:hypothetical protein